MSTDVPAEWFEFADDSALLPPVNEEYVHADPIDTLEDETP